MVTTAVIETSIKEVFKDDLAKIEDLNGLASLHFRDGTDIQIAADSQNSRVILFEVKRLSPASRVAYLELANRLNDNMNFGISFIRRDQDTPKGEPDRWLLISKTYLPYGSKLSIAKLCSYLREFWHGYASGNLKKNRALLGEEIVITKNGRPTVGIILEALVSRRTLTE